MRRAVTAATSLCLLLAGTSMPARAAGNSPPVAVDDPACVVQPPDAFGGSYPVTEDWHDWSFLALGCAPLVNDSDPDGDPLSVELVGQPAHGEAAVIPGAPDDWLEYRPAKDWSTARGDQGGDWVSDVITYRAFDGQAYSNEASYRLWVAPVNDPPTFTPGPALIETQVGAGPVSVQWATDVSPGPANENDQSVHFEIYPGFPDDIFAVKPTIDGDGVLTFTPGTKPWLATIYVYAQDDGGLEDWNFSRSAPFDYPDDTSDQVTFQIAIYPAPQAPPVAVDDELTVAEDTPGHVSVIGNDTDINGDNLALTAVGAAGKGTATIDAPGSWQVDYEPTSDANGPDSFTYSVSDGHGGTDIGTVHVTITPVNDEPVAGDDAVVVAQGAEEAPLSVLDNDDDVDGDTLAVSSASGAVNGSLDVTGGGLTYTPAAGYAGPDAFTYTVSDGAGGHDTASVAVTVTPDAAPPIVGQLADAFAGGTIGASTVPVRLSWHGSDAVSGVAAYQLQQQAAGGAWKTVALEHPTSTSITRSLMVGEASRFRVRAKDGAGNWSAYAAWAPIAPQRRQEGSAAIAWTGTWHPTRDARYSAGHAWHATVHARRATFTFNGHGIGFVSRRSPGAGKAEIRLDGTLVATIDLSGPTSYRRIAFHRELAAGGPHTIQVRPVGDGRIDVDAFIVLP